MGSNMRRAVEQVKFYLDTVADEKIGIDAEDLVAVVVDALTGQSGEKPA